ncbi:hypothetical protein, partial [Ferrovibrio sp.]|uniref:hypothetical protein n=1 Tax=Ferrovibrio sp. TaxID=1917215 RepID=UPI001B3DBEAB
LQCRARALGILVGESRRRQPQQGQGKDQGAEKYSVFLAWFAERQMNMGLRISSAKRWHNNGVGLQRVAQNQGMLRCSRNSLRPPPLPR